LGLDNLTIETTVQITVQQTPQNVVVALARNGPLIAGVVAAVAGGILLLVLIIGGHIRPHSFGKRKKTKSLRERRAEASDPVTQPVPVPAASRGRRLSSWVNRLSWPQRRGSSAAPAYLEPLETVASASPDPLNRIALTAAEITLGRDPTQATITLNDPSVTDLHARLRKTADGGFIIQDEGSVAGTWVNYDPVAPEGTKLQHGDMIHIGRVGLCLTYSDANRIPKLKVLDTKK
jgi:hypothetical protein